MRQHFQLVLQPLLEEIRRGGGEDATLEKIDRIVSEFARDLAKSIAFRDSVSTWLATDFTLDELKAYYEWMRSPLGRKISLFESKLALLLGEMSQRYEKGRFAEIQHLVFSAKQNQRETRTRTEGTPAGKAKPSPPPFQITPPPLRR